jgi:hypothetical protein
MWMMQRDQHFFANLNFILSLLLFSVASSVWLNIAVGECSDVVGPMRVTQSCATELISLLFA